MAIVVIDPAPVYASRKTPSGCRLLNANVFDMKQQIRDRTGGRFTIHAADTRSTAARELTLLFSKNPETWLSPTTRDGDVVDWPHDPIASHGWVDLAEMYKALSWSVTYVDIDGAGRPETQPIRLLTSEFKEVLSILAAKPRTGFLPKWSGSLAVSVSGRDVPIELRRVGDGYLDPSWAETLIHNRTFAPNGVYELRGNDLLEVQLYDRIVHSTGMSKASLEQLRRLANRTETEVPPWLTTPDAAGAHLEAIMTTNGYAITRPLDQNVVFNHSVAGSAMPGVKSLRDAIARWWHRIIRATMLSPARTLGLGVREWMLLRFPNLRSLEEVVRGRRST